MLKTTSPNTIPSRRWSTKDSTKVSQLNRKSNYSYWIMSNMWTSQIPLPTKTIDTTQIGDIIHTDVWGPSQALVVLKISCYLRTTLPPLLKITPTKFEDYLETKGIRHESSIIQPKLVFIGRQATIRESYWRKMGGGGFDHKDAKSPHTGEKFPTTVWASPIQRGLFTRQHNLFLLQFSFQLQCVTLCSQ